MFEKDICRSVQEDDKGLNELSRRDSARWSGIPCPAILGEAAHPTPQSQQSVPEEDPSLDEMSKAVEDVVATLVFLYQHSSVLSSS
jgi:hypothetical protein